MPYNYRCLSPVHCIPRTTYSVIPCLPRPHIIPHFPHTFPLPLQASRQHYCINKAVIKTGRIDEECEVLAKDNNCRFRPPGRGARPGSMVQVCVAWVRRDSRTRC